MERRCMVCGQLPKTDFTYPHNKEEAKRWQNVLNFFVPAETLQHCYCVCNKHIKSTTVDKSVDSVNNLNNRHPSVTFKESDAVLYYGDQSVPTETNQCKVQRQSKAFEQRENPKMKHQSGNMENIRTHQEKTKIQYPLQVRRTSGFDSQSTKSTTSCNSSGHAVSEKNSMEKHSVPQSNQSSCAVSETTCMVTQLENSLPMPETSEAQTHQRLSAAPSTYSSRYHSSASSLSMNLENQFAHNPRKQPYQDQKQQNGRKCPFCHCVLDCQLQDFRRSCFNNGVSNTVKATNDKAKKLEDPSCSQSPPLNVLIMGGSTLPTYCNKRNFGEESSEVSVIRVLESDFSREKAIFSDIDEPKYSKCHQPEEVLLMGVAQNENDKCKENEGRKSSLKSIVTPQQDVSNQSVIQNPKSQDQKNQFDELANLLAQQQKIQQSIQIKLDELQGKSQLNTKNFRIDAGAFAKPKNPAFQILTSMASSRKSK